MRVFNETTKRMCASTRTVRVITRIYDDVIEFGYVSCDDPNICECLISDKFHGNRKVYIRKTEENADKLIFSKEHGVYVVPIGFPDHFISECKNVMGQGNFPYSFRRYYEAFNNFGLFKDKQVVIHPEKSYKLSDYLKYTFGVEFETSMGYIPQDILFRDGLIPLRDGSITGLEYSTVILNAKTGINLLSQQVETLKEFTFYNKECSLHIHLGGYPVDEKAIFLLYTVACMLEGDLASYVPKYTFCTSRYKASGKDYCNLLPRYSTFNAMYTAIAQQEYPGNLYEPHPCDQDRSHKWDCHARYVWCNILNMICYDKGKTVEFRFLRPTYNFYKIYLWLYIFNGILSFCEMAYNKVKHMSDIEMIRAIKKSYNITLSCIMNEVYPTEIADVINYNLSLLRYAVINQNANCDYIGKDTVYEECINEESLHGLL